MRNSSISSSVSHLKLDGSRGCNVAHPYKLLASRHYVVIAFAGVVVSHAKGVASRVLVADHCHPSPDALMDEQILINIIEKIQFHVLHFARTNQGKCDYEQDEEHNVRGTRL